jgi:hypothetical protein
MHLQMSSCQVPHRVLFCRMSSCTFICPVPHSVLGDVDDCVCAGNSAGCNNSGTGMLHCLPSSPFLLPMPPVPREPCRQPLISCSMLCEMNVTLGTVSPCLCDHLKSGHNGVRCIWALWFVLVFSCSSAAVNCPPASLMDKCMTGMYWMMTAALYT